MLLEISFVVVMALGLAFLFWIMLRNASRNIAVQYVILSERFGLELTQPPAQLVGFNRPEPFVHGEYRSRELSISVPGKGLQNTRQIETTLKVAVDAPSFSFQMTGSGLLGRMRQRNSGTRTRWSSGDSAFDQAVDTRTNNDARLVRVLGPQQQAKVLEFLSASKGSIVCRDGMLIFAKLGLLSKEANRELFEAVAEFFCDWAERIEACD
jgi:hypothetical protein